MVQVVIPMTGYGSRFVSAGYTRLKPFIQVFGKTIIEHIVSMYDEDNTKFIFICREEHLQTKPEFHILKNIVKHYEIVSLKTWEKRGPVNDFYKSCKIGKIDYNLPVIINYCDFFCLWNSNNFIAECKQKNCAGAIPCYTAFHPHLIHKNNVYASCNIDENNNLKEIREKFSFNKNKFLSHHSPGIYYFSTGKIAESYSKKLLLSNNSINGEYYASLIYNYMVKDGLTVWCPDNISYFCQWGTPLDLEEFEFYINALNNK